MKTLVWLCAVIFLPLQLMAQDVTSLRIECQKLRERGLWKDALDFYKEKLLPVSDGSTGADLSFAAESFRNLNDWSGFDGLVEEAVAKHPQNAALLKSAAKLYQNAPHSGRLIAGEFQRDNGRGFYGRRGGIMPSDVPEASAGSSVNTEYRDHVRSLQLLLDAAKHAENNGTRWDVWNAVAETLSDDESWKLQTLTPINESARVGRTGTRGRHGRSAPWAKDAPVLHEVPEIMGGREK
jgi:hypothetical protein